MHQDEWIAFYIVLVIIYLIVNGILASHASRIAQEKGYEKRKWFHMCFWLGPVAYIIVAAMPDQVMRENQRQMNLLLGRLLGDSAEAEQPEISEKKDDDAFPAWFGNCDMCEKRGVQVRSVKIVDEMGTRYRNVCSECAKKYHCVNV